MLVLEQRIAERLEQLLGLLLAVFVAWLALAIGGIAVRQFRVQIGLGTALVVALDPRLAFQLTV